jgi:thiol-disulfide isomerase/thioredoxin
LLLAGIATLGAGYGVHLWLDSQPSDAQPGLRGHPKPVSELPVFSLPDLQGHTRISTEWLGQVLVVNFWATWCPPCRREMPLFVDLQERFGTRGLQFVGIAIDEPQPVKKFAESIGVNYPILLGETEAISLSQSLGNRFGSLPFTVVFDRSGKRVFVQTGELDRQMLDEQAIPLL